MSPGRQNLELFSQESTLLSSYASLSCKVFLKGHSSATLNCLGSACLLFRSPGRQLQVSLSSCSPGGRAFGHYDQLSGTVVLKGHFICQWHWRNLSSAHSLFRSFGSVWVDTVVLVGRWPPKGCVVVTLGKPLLICSGLLGGRASTGRQSFTGQ